MLAYGKGCDASAIHCVRDEKAWVERSARAVVDVDTWRGRKLHFETPESAAALRDVAVQAFQLETPERSRARPFRVGVLNRSPQDHRSILNAPELLAELTARLPSGTLVDEAIFDTWTFRQQVSWMYSHDVLVTTHGTPEILLPFMPRCGAVVTLLNKGFYR